MRLGSSTDKKDTGRLHVDFAQARDDLYEWECRQRLYAREERHRRRMEEDRFRPPSPPPIVHYSDHECSLLGDKIKGGAQFPRAYTHSVHTDSRSTHRFTQYSQIHTVHTNSHSTDRNNTETDYSQTKKHNTQTLTNPTSWSITVVLL